MKQAPMNRKTKLALSLLLTIAAAAAAIGFSGQTAAVSGGMSKNIARYILEWLGMDTAQSAVSALDFYLRKGAHFTLYLLMGVGLMGIFLQQKRVPPGVAAVVVGVLFAASDEIHQLFVPGRGCQLRDVVLDGCGVLTGTLLVWLAGKLWARRRRKED